MLRPANSSIGVDNRFRLAANSATAVLALATAALLAVLILVSVVDLSREIWSTQPRWITGVWLGCALFAIRSLGAWADTLYRWAMRLPFEFDHPSIIVRRGLVTLVGFIVIAALVWQLVSVLNASVPTVITLSLMAVFPVFEFVVQPALLFMVRPRAILESPLLRTQDQMQQWADDYLTPAFSSRVVVQLQPGRRINAYTTGIPPFRRYVVVGEGLLHAFPTSEVRAILAHEVAHVVRHDVAKLGAAALLGAIVYAFAIHTAYGTLLIGGSTLGRLVVTVASTIGIAALTGVLSRRLELGADARAVALTGDSDALCAALVGLARTKGRSTAASSLTHPSIDERVAAIRAH